MPKRVILRFVASNRLKLGSTRRANLAFRTRHGAVVPGCLVSNWQRNLFMSRIFETFGALRCGFWNVGEQVRIGPVVNAANNKAAWWRARRIEW